MKQLYTTLIRPMLEYGHGITYPRYKKSAILFENIQRRSTKLVRIERKRLWRKTEWVKPTIPVLPKRLLEDASRCLRHRTIIEERRRHYQKRPLFHVKDFIIQLRSLSQLLFPQSSSKMELTTIINCYTAPSLNSFVKTDLTNTGKCMPKVKCHFRHVK